MERTISTLIFIFSTSLGLTVGFGFGGLGSGSGSHGLPGSGGIGMPSPVGVPGVGEFYIAMHDRNFMEQYVYIFLIPPITEIYVN